MVLNHFVSEVLADVDVLGTFSSANNMVSTFNACSVVFINQSIVILQDAHIVQQITKVYYLNCYFGSRVIFCLSHQKQYCLLQFRLPKHYRFVVLC